MNAALSMGALRMTLPRSMDAALSMGALRMTPPKSMGAAKGTTLGVRMQIRVTTKKYRLRIETRCKQ